MTTHVEKILAGVACAAFVPYHEYALTLRAVAGKTTVVHKVKTKILIAHAAGTAECLVHLTTY